MGVFAKDPARVVGATVIDEPGAPPLALVEAKDWLRIAGAGEDATIAALIAAAGAMCESFTGQLLIERGCSTAIAGGGWQRLGATPVRAIESVETMAGAAVASTGYDADIDIAGDGWVRIKGSGPAQVRYRAGLAVAAAGVPDGLRQGLLRMVAHLYATRGGGSSDGGNEAPPAAVTALWRPWRRLRL